MKPYTLITHTDLDGAACAIVFRLACNNAGVSENSVDILVAKNPQHASIIANRYLDELERSDVWTPIKYLYIADMSVDEETAMRIDKLSNEHGYFWSFLYDHHKTALSLNKYDWAIVAEEIPDQEGVLHKTSGAELLYNDGFINTMAGCTDVGIFVRLATLYDTWEWKAMSKDADFFACKKNDGVDAYNQNILFQKMRMDVYVKHMVDKLSLKGLDDIRDLTESEKEMVAEYAADREEYIARKSKELAKVYMRDSNGKLWCVGVCFSDKHSNDLGERLSLDNPDLDIICLIDLPLMKCEVRTARNDVDSSEFSKWLGGGGHPNASGFQLTPGIVSNIAQISMSKIVYDITGKEV